MQLFFAGAEVASHLAVLRTCGVQRVAVNVTNLARSCHDLEHWATRDRLGGLEWVLYADGPNVSAGPALEVLKGAEVQPEIVTGPISWYEGTWLSNSDLLFLPIWDATDPTILRDYTENYDGVTLPDSVVDNPVAVRQARASIKRLGQLAALTGRSKGIERFDTLVSSAWWAVQKYGETQVWAANRLVRLNSEDKRNKRERYSSAIEAMGVDMDKIFFDDPTETLTLAVRSWQALEQHLTTSPRSLAVVPDQIVTNGHSRPVRVTPDNRTPDVANGGSTARHLMLPVIGITKHGVTGHDENGNEFEDSVNTISVTPESLRQCNSCVLALTCPSHYPGAACSYQIPVEIKTKVQLVNVLRAVTEIQTQRVLMGRFSEEVQGEPNPELGKEMDRLFAMVEKWRNIEDTRDTIKMTLESKGDTRAANGVLSRLFGAQVGQNAIMLEEPLDSNEIMDEMTDG
jgi:hypothetical protein